MPDLSNAAIQGPQGSIDRTVRVETTIYGQFSNMVIGRVSGDEGLGSVQLNVLPGSTDQQVISELVDRVGVLQLGRNSFQFLQRVTLAGATIVAALALGGITAMKVSADQRYDRLFKELNECRSSTGQSMMSSKITDRGVEFTAADGSEAYTLLADKAATGASKKDNEDANSFSVSLKLPEKDTETTFVIHTATPSTIGSAIPTDKLKI